ncbi:MAG: hypothetical protein Q9169_007913 [Polycauliona sp. 2 TL-2023]
MVSGIGDPEDHGLDFFDNLISQYPQPPQTSSQAPGSQALHSYLTSHNSPTTAIRLLALYITARDTAALPPESLAQFRNDIAHVLQYETSIDMWARILSFYCKDAERCGRADGDLKKCLAGSFYGKDFYEDLDRNGKFARLKWKERGWWLASLFPEALAAAMRCDDAPWMD